MRCVQRAMNGLRRARLAALFGIAMAIVALGLFATAGPAAACQGPGAPFPWVVRNADRIVVGRVLSKTGDGGTVPWRYSIQVEEVAKGGPLPDVWTTGKLRDNDCSYYWLDVGEHVVLEYSEPTPPGHLAHYFEWKVADDGSVVPGPHHKSPYQGSLPRTLDELLAGHRALLPATDAATHAATGATPPQEGTALPTLIATGTAAAAGAGTWWFSMRRRPRRLAG